MTGATRHIAALRASEFAPRPVSFIMQNARVPEMMVDVVSAVESPNVAA